MLRGLPRRLDFTDHRRELDAYRYVYAVVSRRSRGLSVGVNLNPDKVCNFDCPYCQVDRTTPGDPSLVDVEALAAELDDLLQRASAPGFWATPPFDTVAAPLRRLADVAFSGDGEPTTPPAFPEAAAAARAVRDRRAPGAPLRLITNATMLDRPRVRDALGSFHELWCKLDAGTPEYFALADGTRFPFDRLLANLLAVARERPIVLQSLFLAWAGAGPSDAELAAYVERVRELREGGGRIASVQVYTVARRPADARAGALPLERLEQIAARVRELGIQAEAFA